MDMVYLPLKSCELCPYNKSSRYYTSDSSEYVTAWNCEHPKLRSKYKGRNAETDREVWHSPPGIAQLDGQDKVPKIPTWCVLRRL